ncbi:MAG: hypothetical protein ACK8QZ_03475 [Anaerolineales bacterium]
MPIKNGCSSRKAVLKASATAHKLARIVYHLLKYKVEYQTLSAQEYEQAYRKREIHYLQRKAAFLGFTLTPSPGAVS